MSNWTGWNTEMLWDRWHDRHEERTGVDVQAMLKAIEAHIAENNNGRRKIQSAMVTCQEMMAKLSPGIKASSVIIKEVNNWRRK